MSRRIVQCVLGVLFFAASLAASDISGIWAGQQQGRLGQPEDVAFRFQLDGSSLTGKMFGDEFDLPIGEASVSGDQVRFTVTTINYYNKTKVVFVYTGIIKGSELELTRERVATPEDRASNRPNVKQTLKLKRL